MNILHAIVLSIIEGLTEFLPISSTGHMILAEGAMKVEGNEFVSAFTVMIQLGAILSVVILYWKRFFIFHLPEDLKGSPKWRQAVGRLRFYWKLLLAMIPAGIAGILLEKQIDLLLNSVWIVALMLIIGGIVMILADNYFINGRKEKPTFANAFLIGCYQCLAMIPGTSRSMVTILGGQQQGLSRKAAAEFSFFLAVPTMFGATLVKLKGLIQAPSFATNFTHEWKILLVGNIVSFIVALIAIKLFIDILTKYGFKPFGWYRIILGTIVIIALWMGFLPATL